MSNILSVTRLDGSFLLPTLFLGVITSIYQKVSIMCQLLCHTCCLIHECVSQSQYPHTAQSAVPLEQALWLCSGGESMEGCVVSEASPRLYRRGRGSVSCDSGGLTSPSPTRHPQLPYLPQRREPLSYPLLEALLHCG